MYLQAYHFIIRFPQFFFHQIICPDNPVFQALTKRSRNPDPNWYKSYLREEVTEMKVLEVKKTKAEIII